MAAAYNAPIGAAMFVMEIVHGNFALEVFGPVVLASVTATMVTWGAFGSAPLYPVPLVPAPSLLTLPLFALLGALVAWTGVVFRGFHLSLSRPIAVKIFKPRPGNDSAEALERFRMEGRSAARIEHPNAVQVFDCGISSDGLAYLVMQLLEGRTLEVRAEIRRSGRQLPDGVADRPGHVDAGLLGW